jgi:uncharacterized protein YecE (DUF72 family)
MMGDVRIGTSGWSYPTDPGAWTGIFYPKASRGRGWRSVDELTFYAEHFDTVEVNSSFYHVPDARTTRSWVNRTPVGFDFSLKLFQKFTHPAMYRKAAGLPEPGGHDAPSTPVVNTADAEQFKRAIDPLAEAGKLGVLLSQFPPSFKRDDHSRDYLQWLLDTFHAYPMAVELRHRSWSDATEDTVALLGAHSAAWVQIDEPKFRFSIRQDFTPNQRGLFYMRLHGRNADAWWKHDSPAERYDYLYSPKETGELVGRVDEVRHLVNKIYLYLNNHFAAKAVANAAAIRHDLGQAVPGRYTPEMLVRYPILQGLVDAGEPSAPRQEQLEL